MNKIKLKAILKAAITDEDFWGNSKVHFKKGDKIKYNVENGRFVGTGLIKDWENLNPHIDYRVRMLDGKDKGKMAVIRQDDMSKL